ncbi:MAG: general secretion pathway protein GspB [Desulfobacterales bacterium]|nr:general secretion pathway protein GspB [Desulfobacterales bacterium]
MNKREKIILVLMGLAVLYGAFEYLWPSGESAAPGQKKQSTEELSAYVTGIAASLPQMSVSKAEKYAIASAAAKWTQDPFLQVRLPEKQDQAETEETISAEEFNLRYTGYIEMGANRIAIINGREYGIGEFLKETPYRLKDISPNRVLIQADNQEKSFVLPIEENSF